MDKTLISLVRNMITGVIMLTLILIIPSLMRQVFSLLLLQEMPAVPPTSAHPDPPAVASPSPSDSGVSGHTVWMIVLGVLGTAVGLLLIATAVMFAINRQRARTRRLEEVGRIREVWTTAGALKDTLEKKVSAWEFNLEQRYFIRPVIADTKEPLVQRWLDAQSTMTDAFSTGMPDDESSAKKALDEATAASEAWNVLWNYAGRIGLSKFNRSVRKDMERGMKLLAMATDDATTEAERGMCLDRLSVIIEGVASDPTQVRGELTTYVWKQLAIPSAVTRMSLTA